MNSARTSLIWSAIPTLFDVPNPPQRLATRRRSNRQKVHDSRREKPPAASFTSLQFHTYAMSDSKATTSGTTANHQPAAATTRLVSVQQSPTNVQLLRKLNVAKKKLSRARVALCRKQQKHKVKNEFAFRECERCKGFRKLPSHVQVFFQMQLDAGSTGKQGMRYSDDNKMLALGLYHKSPAAYRFLRRHFHLPSDTTLRSHISSMKLRPGFDSESRSTVVAPSGETTDRSKIG